MVLVLRIIYINIHISNSIVVILSTRGHCVTVVTHWTHRQLRPSRLKFKYIFQLFHMASSPDYLGYAYAAIVFLGGAIGYLKAGSTMSLLSGVTFGGAMGYAANLVSKNPTNKNANAIAFALAATLLIFMGMRFNRSGKFMPAGLVSLLR